MTKFFAKFIVIALLFVSAEAAVCSTFHLFDNDEEVSHLYDNDGQAELFEENSCNHLCHCAHHFATFSTDISLIPNNSDQEASHYTDHYSSKDSPPLFRPPIA
ncbi:MAG: hypothetical protein R8G33_03370 [Gammaproteobacteria bacterium]|nr:hypothetical protein [Gammaproteobacteria bacterium]